MAADTQVKPMRLCIGCQQTDDHPRHVISGSQPWHMDCHVLATGCGLCSAQLAACDTSTEADGVIGEVLRERLAALPQARVTHDDDNPAGPVQVVRPDQEG
ncbi:MAG: hypothetical protein ACRCZP_01275 [Phycicoccus sp.]